MTRMFVAIDNATHEALLVNCKDTEDAPGTPEVVALLASKGHREVQAALIKMFGDTDWLRFRFSVMERDVEASAPKVNFLSNGIDLVPIAGRVS